MMNSKFNWLVGSRYVPRSLRKGWGSKLAFVQECSFGENGFGATCMKERPYGEL
jgi:hypothetical protein